jgi:hypothetical protein
VEEPRRHVILENTWTKIDMDCIVNLGEPTNVSKRQLLHYAKSQTPFCLKNLLFVPHLPAKKTHGKEPLINNSRSHIVTSNEYL